MKNLFLSITILIITIFTIYSCSNDSCVGEGLVVSITPSSYVADYGDTVSYDIKLSSSGELTHLKIESVITDTAVLLYEEISGKKLDYEWNYIMPSGGLTEGQEIKIIVTATHKDWNENCDNISATEYNYAFIEYSTPPGK